MSIRSTSLFNRRVTALAAALPIALSAEPAAAQVMTAGVIMEKMNADQRSGFLAGVVEGLAHDRMVKDGETAGSKCIYDWFYEKEGTLHTIHQAFEYFRDEMPGAVIAAMVEKECGN